jgi:ribosomal protein L15E
MSASSTDKPWKQPKPKKAGQTKLTPTYKAKAKAAAARAGRRYPNLVDNMHAAKAQKQAQTKRPGRSKSRP